MKSNNSNTIDSKILKIIFNKNAEIVIKKYKNTEFDEFIHKMFIDTSFSEARKTWRLIIKEIKKT